MAYQGKWLEKWRQRTDTGTSGAPTEDGVTDVAPNTQGGFLAAAAPYVAAAVAGGVRGLFGGGNDQPNQYSALYALSPQQQALQHQMQNRALLGDVGDTGFGQNVKQGTTQLQQMMADSGISMDSGVGVAGTGEVIAGASAQDAENRSRRMLDIASMSPAFMNSGWETGRHNLWQTDPTGQYRMGGQMFGDKTQAYMLGRST